MTKLTQSERNAVNTKSAIESYYGTGRRKRSVARVWVKRGNGKFLVNKKDALSLIFDKNGHHSVRVNEPLKVLDLSGKYDVSCTVYGGGLTGQIDAIRHGLSNALAAISPECRKTLRQEGMLTRDSRIVEKKKYGQHKARKKYRFVKR